jgi:protoheme IX farnesyltransferase
VTTQNVFRTYYSLVKPGIIRGNLITATAGFLLASKTDIDARLLLATLAGTALIIASGCVFNNYMDRSIDKKMARTKKRALVQGIISGRNAIAYAIVLGVLGLSVLAVLVNVLTAVIGLLGLFFYVIVYGYWKRRSTLGTVVGSISGAVPPVAGYTAVTSQLDAAALILFLILVCWQMPHFYSIAIYRRKDYATAGLPVLPVKKGMHLTKIYILLYIAGFTAVASLLTVFGFTGYVYLTMAIALGLAWFWKGLAGFKVTDDVHWARGMFFFSLLVITVLSATISAEALLP